MDRLELARVPDKTSLRSALAKIRPGTRAVVVTGANGHRIVTAGEILAACNDAVDAGRDPASIPVAEAVAATGPEVAAESRDLLDKRSVLDARIGGDDRAAAKRGGPALNHLFSITGVTHDAAVVVTASGRFAANLSGNLEICTCDGDPVHSFERRDLVVPGRCNKPHGVPVTCS